MSQANELIDNLKSYLADARDICERGEFMTLEGLDERVKTICAAVQTLPVPEAMQHADTLDSLMQELETLQTLMQDKRAALGEELSDTGKHHKAAKAYTRHEHATPKE